MIIQDGTLVILIKDFFSKTGLHPGTYFLLKLGDHSLRFNRVKGELVYKINKEDCEKPLQMYMFRREGKPSDFTKGRRRKLIDQSSVKLFEQLESSRDETRIDWKGVRFCFTTVPIGFTMDIEFYPSGPVLPPKRNQFEQPKEVPSSLPVQHAERKPLPVVPKTEEKSSKKSKRAHFFPIHRHMSRKKSVKEKEDDIIYYRSEDVVKYQQGEAEPKPCQEPAYQHGDIGGEISTIPGKEPEDLYKFIKQNQYRPGLNDVLPVHTTPREFFKSPENRLKYDQDVGFHNFFPSNNVRLTGYLGRGKWHQNQVSCAFLSLYMMPTTNPLPAPPLPPKCPKNMLWEEYYLINKDQYIKDVLRDRC